MRTKQMPSFARHDNRLPVATMDSIHKLSKSEGGEALWAHSPPYVFRIAIWVGQDAKFLKIFLSSLAVNVSICA